MSNRSIRIARPPQRKSCVRNMTMAYGSFVLMSDLNFTVRRGDIFIIMGGSGCGKSTLLRHLIGLKEPATGEIIYGDVNFTRRRAEVVRQLLRRFGVLYQSGRIVEFDDTGRERRACRWANSPI